MGYKFGTAWYLKQNENLEKTWRALKDKQDEDHRSNMKALTDLRNQLLGPLVVIPTSDTD